KQGAYVIWIGLPVMRGAKYNKKITLLNQTLRESLKDKALYISTQEIFTNEDNKYRSSIKIQGTLKRVRGKDGIHITTQGNLQILGLIKKHIVFDNKVEDSSDTESTKL
ncbi:MAG: hypothetical protein KGV50_07695, partial [Gammaproteobacteria bacterium]|nr:hypothetical protein [Gammaproteobacteria bacterium]